jgi:hypothetical protein
MGWLAVRLLHVAYAAAFVTEPVFENAAKGPAVGRRKYEGNHLPAAAFTLPEAVSSVAVHTTTSFGDTATPGRSKQTCFCSTTEIQAHHAAIVALRYLLTSIFLHMYYANMGQITRATFALRDAITFAHILNLGRRQTLDPSQPQENQLQLRIYWVLLVTERRALPSSHDAPTVECSSVLNWE